MTEADRRAAAARHTARYGRIVRECARHAMSDDYSARRAEQLDRLARDSARAALQYGNRAPILDRLERALELEEEG